MSEVSEQSDEQVDESEFLLSVPGISSCFLHATDPTHLDERGTEWSYTPRTDSHPMVEFTRLGSACLGLAAKNVVDLILVIRPPSRGGREEAPCGSNRTFRVAIVVADVVAEDGGGRMSAPVCAAETVIRPSFPENMPLLKDLVFERT